MADPASYRPTDIPEFPGVYRFYNGNEKVIYVGKAINLKARLSNYFQGNLAPRTHRMVHEAVRVDWTIVGSEVEALQLEFSWIKQFDPTYNVQFKDDKSYPYLAISMADKFPRVFITRKEKRPGLVYFGPYIQSWTLRSTFDVILKVFPVRSCSAGNFERAQKSKRQCLLGDIGKCAAPCVGWVSEDEHKELASRLVKFMSVGSSDIVPTLEVEMREAAENQEYERAGKIRDQIEALQKGRESTDAALPSDLSADVIALHEEGQHGAGSIFMIRNGAIRGSRSWIVNQSQVLEGEDQVSSLLFSIYGQASASDIPKEILISDAPLHLEATSKWLSEIKGSEVLIRVPQRGDKVELVSNVKRNAQYALIQYLSKRASDAAVSGKALMQIEEVLGLPKPPLRIECFDISNISGTSVVASMVVFEDGLPKKSEYRRFIIDTAEGWDDTRAMHQVITRRLKRMLDDRNVDLTQVSETGGRINKFAYPPALIVVDGGKPQVSAAQRALNELGITDIALCGLAKRLEEVWLPHNADPLILPRNSEGLYLLQRVRDEAHRFAITFHRSRRSKVMLESLLDEIPGLGSSRRNALLDRFGSVTAIRKAEIAELAATPGIGEKLAQVIAQSLAKVGQSEVVNVTTGEILE
jgi:excinuclease ABC subunit C